MSSQIQVKNNYNDEISSTIQSKEASKSQAETSSVSVLHTGLEDLLEFIEKRHTPTNGATVNYAFTKDQRKKTQEANDKILSALREMQAHSPTMTATEATEDDSTTTTTDGSDETDTANTTSGASDETTETPSVDSIFAMEGMLSQLQQLLIESSSEQSQNQVEMGKATLTALQAQYTDLLAQIAKEHEHHSFWWHLKHCCKILVESIAVCTPAAWAMDPKGMMKVVKDIKNDPDLSTFLKVLSYVAMAATVLVAIGTGNFELLAVTAVIFTLSETGGMEDMTKGLSVVLQQWGCSEDLANVLADVLVVVILAGVSGGAAGIDLAADTAASELEEGIEMATLGSSAEEGVEATAETVESSASKMSTFESRIRRALGTFASVTGQALPSTTFVVDLVQALPISEKRRKNTLLLLKLQL